MDLTVVLTGLQIPIAVKIEVDRDLFAAQMESQTTNSVVLMALKIQHATLQPHQLLLVEQAHLRPHIFLQQLCLRIVMIL